MKKHISLALVLMFLFTLLAGCGKQAAEPSKEEAKTTTTTTKPTMQVETEAFDDTEESYEGVKIQLSDEGITVDGDAISADTSQAVYAANDIVLIILWVLATMQSVSYLPFGRPMLFAPSSELILTHSHIPTLHSELLYSTPRASVSARLLSTARSVYIFDLSSFLSVK